MTTTRTSTHVTVRPGGRRVAAELRGPVDGPVVLLSTAAPGSRLLDPDPAATRATGVRLITLDRPGYGGSDPTSEPTITAAADDAAAVLDDLGVTEARVAGWSAGGRVALALAARRPELVRSVAVVATPAPHEQVPWIGDDELALIDHLRDVPDPVAALEPMLAPITADPQAAVQQVSGGADERALARPGVRAALVAMLAEAFARGPAGLAADLVSYTLTDWDFDPRAVGAPVHCFYGAEDGLVPEAHGRWYAAQVADGRLHVVPGAGHLVVCETWADVLARLLR
jgi:pimeloyl-ACP methyl ester carboxylesterase